MMFLNLLANTKSVELKKMLLTLKKYTHKNMLQNICYKFYKCDNY